MIQMVSNDIPGILPVNPEGGKVARATAVSPLIEAGNVYLPHPQFMPWVVADRPKVLMQLNGFRAIANR